MSSTLTGEVWAQLDPSATRLPRRTRLRLTAVAVAIALLVGGVIVLARSGEVAPRLWIESWDVHVDKADQHSFLVTTVISNDDWVDDHIAWVDSTDRYVDGYYPGVRNGFGADGLVIPAHSRRTVDLRFWVRDCAHASRSFDTRVVAVVQRWWGETRASMSFFGFSDDPARTEPYEGDVDSPVGAVCDR